jgi:hypothetical protein
MVCNDGVCSTGVQRCAKVCRGVQEVCKGAQYGVQRCAKVCRGVQDVCKGAQYGHEKSVLKNVIA